MTAPRSADRDARELREAALAGLTLETLADALPFGFIVTDEFGLVLSANEAATSLLGIEHKFVVGKPLVTRVPARYRRTIRSAVASLARERTAFTWEQEVEPRGGDATPVELSAIPLESGLIGWVIQNVRERVAIERRLRTLSGDLEASVLERTEDLETQRARMDAIMGQIPAGLIIVDAPQGNVVSVNDEALRILRVPAIEGAPAWEGRTMDGEDYGPDDWPLVRSRAHGEVVTGERAEVLAGDGSRIVLEISSSPVKDQAGRLLGAVCVFNDVTVRERRERAEREFVTNAAHQLQTPLAALVSAVEVLVGGAKDTPERDLFLDHVKRESDRLTALIRALLTLARVEMGVDAPSLGIVPLRPLLESVARGLKPAPGVSVSVSCPDDLAAVANAELLEQAVVNVAQNAARYTVGGSISIAAARSGDMAQISVSDTGPGISPAERPQIFERFHRGVEGRGSGLGLTIVRSVMEALDGQVELDSQVGVGTTVRLRLPYVTALVGP